MKVLSNRSNLKVSVLLPYPNPHVLDWVIKLEGKIALNVGCVRSTQDYRPGYFAEYDEIENIRYFFKSGEAKKTFYSELKESEILITLGLFEKELILARRYCRNVVRLIVLSEPFNPINSNPKNLLRVIWSWIIRKLYLRVDFLCIGGSEVKKYYAGLGFVRSKYFRFGYFPDLEFNAPRQKIEESNDVVISFIGQLIPRKGIDRLFKLIDYLSNSSYNYKLNVVGAGSLKPMLLKKLQEVNTSNISYLGIIQDKTGIKRLLNETDILFIPSYFDGWGAVVNEAISQSCAVISSDQVFASKVLVVHNFNGFVFLNSFEEYFDKYLNDYKLLNEHKAGSKIIYEKWNSETVGFEVVKILNGETSNLLQEI